MDSTKKLKNRRMARNSFKWHLGERTAVEIDTECDQLVIRPGLAYGQLPFFHRRDG